MLLDQRHTSEAGVRDVDGNANSCFCSWRLRVCPCRKLSPEASLAVKLVRRKVRTDRVAVSLVLMHLDA